MADRKQGAGWSSGSSAAGHKAHWQSSKKKKKVESFFTFEDNIFDKYKK